MSMRFQLQSTPNFAQWLKNLDGSNKNLLLARLARVENGHFGDHKALTSNLYELRCFFGGGLRVYYTKRNQQIVLLLAGGNKSTQNRDIAKAQTLVDDLEEENE